jgi:hypothetical protein
LGSAVALVSLVAGCSTLDKLREEPDTTPANATAVMETHLVSVATSGQKTQVVPEEAAKVINAYIARLVTPADRATPARLRSPAVRPTNRPRRRAKATFFPA